MRSIIRYSILIRLSLFSATALHAQVLIDTLHSDEPEVADTIVIYEEPVVIPTQVTIYRPKERTNKQLFLVGLSVGTFWTIDYSKVCPDCQEYYAQIQASIKKLPGRKFSLDGQYRLNNAMLGLGLSYTIQRYSFSYSTDDSTSTDISLNQIHTLDGIVSGGYWFGKQHKISCIPSAFLVYSARNTVSGKMLAKDTRLIQDLSTVLDYKKRFYAGGVKIKLLYHAFPRLFFTFDISYQYDLKSILNNTGPFTIQRNIPGANIGLVIN